MAPYRTHPNGFVILDANNVRVSDKETMAPQLIFTLLAEPVNGWMVFNGQRMSVGTRFSLADFQRKRLVYRQNGSNNEHDRIILQVSDGQLTSTTATMWFLLQGVADPEPTATLVPTQTRTLVPTVTATATRTMTPSRTATRTRVLSPTRTVTNKPLLPTATPKR